MVSIEYLSVSSEYGQGIQITILYLKVSKTVKNKLNMRVTKHQFVLIS